MKPSTATLLTVAVLLAAATLCPVFVTPMAGEKPVEHDAQPSEARPSANRTPSPDNDPAAAQKAMTRRVQSQLRTANWLERSRNILLLADRLKPDEWPLAMKSLRDLGMSRGGDEEVLLMTAWAEIDPKAAAEYPESLLGSVVPMWMARDPKAAWDWVMSPRNQDNRSWLVGSALEALVRTDLPRIAREISQMKSRDDRDINLGRIARRIAGMEEGTSRRWLDSISDQKLKDEALYALLRGLPKSRIEEKFELLHDQPEMRKRVIGEIYQSWAGADEAAAIASFETLKHGEERQEALDGIVQYLSYEDPVRALDLINSNPGSKQELLLNHWVYNLVEDEPALVLGEIHRFKRPEDREEAYHHVLAKWLENDGTAAREWLRTHELPASLKQEFKPD